MNIDATETTLRAVAETLKLAAILDDRAPHADKARITAWAEQVQRHNLTRDDMLNGLQAFYDGPSQHAIQIGDLIHHARNAKRSRLEKEADDVRDSRREAVDTKAADEMHGIAAGLVAGPVKRRTPRIDKAEIALQCCNGRHEAQAAIHEYFAAKAAR